jgi:hypothetical protein
VIDSEHTDSRIQTSIFIYLLQGLIQRWTSVDPSVESASFVKSVGNNTTYVHVLVTVFLLEQWSKTPISIAQ